MSLGLPLIPVNHLEGHLYSPILDAPDLKPPWISLIASGGHTLLVLVKDWGDLSVLGQTRDDAAGEAFDKVAKLLGLGYPGGPRVEGLAKTGDARKLSLPRPMKGQGYAFSFSGLKTAVHMAKDKVAPADLCASFQEAAIDVLVHKTVQAAQEFGVQQLCLAGGVAANKALRAAFEEACAQRDWTFCVPTLNYCTDNAAMIAAAGYRLAGLGLRATLSLDAHAHLPLRSWRDFK